VESPRIKEDSHAALEKNGENLHQLLSQIWFPLLDRFQGNQEQAFHYKDPDELKRTFDFSLDSRKQASEKDLERILTDVVKYTPNIWSPTSLNYLYSSPDPLGLIGDWLVSLLNSNVHAYEASPVFALAEIEVVKALANAVGYGADSTGIFCPGGSYSNMYAMHLARNRSLSVAREDRVSGKGKLIIFSSEHAHYSIDKAANFLGIGTNSVRKIKCDRRGRMKPEDLRKEIEKAESRGERPLFVNATMGTTVLGAFDPLVDILDVLSSRNIWLHVDAAWGGAVLMSEKSRAAADGIERADSITWDLHKALRSPLLCSALLLKKDAYLQNIFSVDDSYLFHDNGQGDCDLGRKTGQCGRRGDAFKFWLMWKMRGKPYFARQVEERFSKTAEAVAMIKKRKSFRVYDAAPEFWNICFWYIPSPLRKLKNPLRGTEDQKWEIENLTARIYQCLKKDGQALVNYAKMQNHPAFFRLIIGPHLTQKHLADILDIIESLGSVLSSNLQEILISGGDNRLHLDHRGLNYILVAPEPAPRDMVSRSSCTGSYITEENYQALENLTLDIRSARISFQTCMDRVHDRIRDILKIDSSTSIITIPSGTDAEYVPLLIARACAGNGRRVVNIVTGAGEIGTHSATAANGLYYTDIVPSGARVDIGKRVGEISKNIEMIAIPQSDPETGKQEKTDALWVEHVKEKLSHPNALVLLHIVDSSKLGRRMDVIDQVEFLKDQYPGRLLVTIDSCQSRTDIHRTRHYLKLGYIVMITGSKFEEGPPFSGAVIVPAQLTGSLTAEDFTGLLEGLEHFITRYDVSGNMAFLRGFLPCWMNWGLMMRWTCALTNWENYRRIDDKKRNRLIQDWVDGVLKLIRQYPEMEVLDGGEIQPGAVGDRNTIVSIKLLSDRHPLPIKVLKKLHLWLYEDMSDRFPDEIRLNPEEEAVLRRSFLIGKPVDLGKFAVLRIALGAKLACHMEKYGVDRALADDGQLLVKLSLLAKNYAKITAFSEMSTGKVL
jgi:glutamate/tyrosine decarboxylase-like PLP-dependent enzyme